MAPASDYGWLTAQCKSTADGYVSPAERIWAAVGPYLPCFCRSLRRWRIPRRRRAFIPKLIHNSCFQIFLWLGRLPAEFRHKHLSGGSRESPPSKIAKGGAASVGDSNRKDQRLGQPPPTFCRRFQCTT